jgi:hypothetical protein
MLVADSTAETERAVLQVHAALLRRYGLIPVLRLVARASPAGCPPVAIIRLPSWEIFRQNHR